MSNHTISDLGKQSVDSKTAENNTARCGAGEVAGRASSSKSDCYKFGTWNVRSLFQVGKLAGIVQEMERTDLNLLGISETFWNDSGELKPRFQHQIIYTKSSIPVEAITEKASHLSRAKKWPTQPSITN